MEAWLSETLTPYQRVAKSIFDDMAAKFPFSTASLEQGAIAAPYDY